MLNNANKLSSYEKIIDALAQEIARLYEVCGALDEIVKQTNDHPEIYKRFGRFFYTSYLHNYHELYYGISRLVDDTKGVISIIKLLQMKDEDKPAGRIEFAKIEKELVNRIKKNKNLKKIKDFKNNKLGHKNKWLVLDELAEIEFRENNKLSIEDMESLLHFLSDILKKVSERVGFHVLTIPITPIRLEISTLFKCCLLTNKIKF